MLLTIGDLLEEILVRLDAAPVRGVVSSVRSARVRGGSAANVAAIDAEIGGTPRFVGQVGDDALGHALQGELSMSTVGKRSVNHRDYFLLPRAMVLAGRVDLGGG